MLGNYTLSHLTVKKWVVSFKCGRESLKDESCSGHPVSATLGGNINTEQDIITAIVE